MVILVVDSTDRERLTTVREEFYRLLQSEVKIFIKLSDLTRFRFVDALRCCTLGFIELFIIVVDYIFFAEAMMLVNKLNDASGFEWTDICVKMVVYLRIKYVMCYCWWGCFYLL